ncbi:MAG: beta-propeller fold lactonase family protein [Myxococcota bacterium]
MQSSRALRLALTLSLLGLISCSDSDSQPQPPVDFSDGRILLFVANTGGTNLSVIDHETRTVVDTIELGGLPHGQIPSSLGDRLYATTEDTGEVFGIDTRTLEILWRVQAIEEEADELHQPSLTLDNRTLYVPDLFSAQMFVVDVESGTISGTVDIIDRTDPNDPMRVLALHNSYISGDGRHVYVEGILSNRVARVDVETNEVDRMYVLNGQPRPIALMSDSSRMYVQFTNLEGFVEINLETGEEVNRIEWFNTPTDSWTKTLARTKPKSHGIGLNPDQTELWATSTLADKWYVYSVPELEQLAVIDIPEGNAPNWIAFTPDGEFAYVSNTTFVPEPNGEPRTDVNGTVTVINTRTREVVNTIEVGPLPKRVHAVFIPN